MDPRECARDVLQASSTKPAAIVFGPERAGLSNAELDLCQAIVYIPANPEYSSLNLAAAVQLIAWELRYAQGVTIESPPPESPPAGVEDMDLFYEHLQRVLLASGFLDPAQPRNLMRRLRRLFNRARLDQNELNILRGILAAVAPGSGERNWHGKFAPSKPGDDPMTLYLDYAASTPVEPAVADAMAEALRSPTLQANCASAHQPGRTARERVEAARAEVAALIGARRRGDRLDVGRHGVEQPGIDRRGALPRRPRPAPGDVRDRARLGARELPLPGGERVLR